MSDSHRRAIVHNIGHHEVVIELANERGARLQARPDGPFVYSLGEVVRAALRDETTTLTPTDTPSLWRLSPPLCLSDHWSPGKLGRRLQLRPSDRTLDQPQAWTTDGPWSIVHIHVPLVGALLRDATTGWDTHVALVTTGAATGRQRGLSPEPWGWFLQQLIHAHGGATAEHHHHVTPTSAHSYDGLPGFLAQHTLQWLERVRAPVVREHKENWQDHFEVVLSLNTGASPRIVALTSALAPFQPKLLHVHDARKWPEEGRHTSSLLSHDQLRQAPPTRDLSPYSEAVRRAVAELRAWKRDFIAARPMRQDKSVPARECDFFFRKGRQEVLAVVVLQIEDRLETVRGVNVEVSLPTGTLCAERNAIGTAVALHPALERKQIAAVAVLGLNRASPRLGPCGACTEWLRKVAEVNPSVKVVSFADHDLESVFVEPVG